MKFRTSISHHKDGEFYIRGKKLIDLVGNMSFTEAIYFVIRGEKPTDTEIKMLDIILVAAINHGVEAPSGFVPRVVASTGNSINAAIAAGVLSIGEHHGGAVDDAMRILQSGNPASEIVQSFTGSGERIPGFGHKVYKDVDPRVEAILKRFEELGVKSNFINLAQDIRNEIQKQTGRKLPLNIDGIIAVTLCELGFDPILGKAFFALARIPGMMANIQEEIENEKPYRRLEDEDVEYTGK